ncbi:thioredoxin [Acidihalobacter yilgarnensis]|uniref:Thioredoxin n=1 Tax=Acidihalobacter yilgarnensis TaxID=2819280 RepID=A0A1D8IL68_9GAMM|nr:thioredoxin family protein [Acidihalobacter yilgarnensis]AOU97183.1 thioredoxin [Acidihalobacter yilgarnensis]
MRFTPLTQFDFHHRLAEVPGTALVLFTAPGCGACRRMHTVLAALAPHHPDWRVFEVDAGQDLALTREFEVFHLPGLFLYRNGHYHAALETEAVPARVEAAVRLSSARPSEEMP